MSREHYFYIVKEKRPFHTVLDELYRDETSKDTGKIGFCEINEPFIENGEVEVGQMLYIPPMDGVTAAEIEDIRWALAEMQKTHQDLSPEERQILAENHEVLSAVASYSSVGFSASSSMIRFRAKQIAEALQELDTAYVNAVRQHGKNLSPRTAPGFYALRRRLFERLDTALGHLTRRIILPDHLESAKIKNQLGISTKREIFDWKRLGDDKTNVRNFPKYHQNTAKRYKGGKMLGRIAIAVDGGIRARNIYQACKDHPDSRYCHRTATVETAGFAGGVAGGVAGGWIGYGICSIGFAPFSAGTSFVWCGIIAGAVGGAAGGYLASDYAEHKSGVIFDNHYPVLIPQD